MSAFWWYGGAAEILLLEAPVTYQYARPVADASNSGWKRSSDGGTTDLYTMIDEETADHSDYIFTDPGAISEDVYVTTLGSMSVTADGSENYGPQFWVGKHDGGTYTTDGQVINLKVELLPPAGNDTPIATWGPNAIGSLTLVTFAVPDTTVLESSHRARFTKTVP